MKILVMIAQKGGTGKTTLACALACALGIGRPARLLDLDPQGSAAHWGERRKANAAGGLPDVPVEPVTKRTLPDALAAAAGAGTGIAVIDTPPHTRAGVLDAGVLADLVLVPTRPAIHDVLGIATTIRVCREAKVAAPVYALVNQAAPAGPRNRQFLGSIERYGIPTCPHLVVRRVAHEDSAILGQSAAEYAPKDPAAAEIRALARWTEQHLFEAAGD